MGWNCLYTNFNLTTNGLASSCLHSRCFGVDFKMIAFPVMNEQPDCQKVFQCGCQFKLLISFWYSVNDKWFGIIMSALALFCCWCQNDSISGHEWTAWLSKGVSVWVTPYYFASVVHIILIMIILANMIKFSYHTNAMSRKIGLALKCK